MPSPVSPAVSASSTPPPSRRGHGARDDVFLETLDIALERIAAYAPGAVVVALGLDAFEGDPLAGLAVSTDGFRRIGERCASIGAPTVIVQEGGYLCDALSSNLTSFLTGFGARHTV